MNKFSVALVSMTIAVAQASTLKASTAQYAGPLTAKPDFSIGQQYHAPDYNQPYERRESLPSGDFNRRVYEFDNDQAIFDQKDYEERVKVEAELMVALESLKEAISYGSYDVNQLSSDIQQQYHRITDNAEDIYENMARQGQQFAESVYRVNDAQARCQYTQRAIHDTKDVLILYCQQFAYAPEMVPACNRILTHKMCQVDHRYKFGGSDNYYNQNNYHVQDGYGHEVQFDQAHDPYYQEFASTHGIELNQTGGHVEPANAYTDPELAAAAVSPYEAVIQADGVSHVVPFDQIDTDKTELACNDHGCALIPDDGNPYNDIEAFYDGANTGYDDSHNQYQADLDKAELQAAQHNEHEVRVQVDGVNHLVPIDAVDPSKVELNCDGDECYLVPDDGNPHNDIIPGDHLHSSDYKDQQVFEHANAGLFAYDTSVSTASAAQLSADAEIAAAQHNEYEVRVQVDGQNHLVPIDEIDTSKVELNCDGQQCYLVPDDGNPHNDIIPGDHEHSIPASSPAPAAYDGSYGQFDSLHSSQTYDHSHDELYPGMPDYGPYSNDHPAQTTYSPEPFPAAYDSFHDGFDIPASMQNIHDEIYNSHGIDFPIVGGNVQVDRSVNPELAAAAYDQNNAVLIHNGEAFLAPFDSINTDAVEIACRDDGCALIPDDGIAHNDIYMPGMY